MDKKIITVGIGMIMLAFHCHWQVVTRFVARCYLIGNSTQGGGDLASLVLDPFKANVYPIGSLFVGIKHRLSRW